jgi:hypothetical protein
MKFCPLIGHFYSMPGGRTLNRADLQMLSFYPTRHHPFIKQVHSNVLTTILALTEDISDFFSQLNRKDLNT